MVLSGDSSHPYDVHFKLADLGLSHFKRTEKLSSSIADSDVGGTKDYGKRLLSYSTKNGKLKYFMKAHQSATVAMTSWHEPKLRSNHESIFGL